MSIMSGAPAEITQNVGAELELLLNNLVRAGLKIGPRERIGANALIRVQVGPRCAGGKWGL